VLAQQVLGLRARERRRDASQDFFFEHTGSPRVGTPV
jgi:hypothetical protein